MGVLRRWSHIRFYPNGQVACVLPGFLFLRVRHRELLVMDRTFCVTNP